MKNILKEKWWRLLFVSYGIFYLIVFFIAESMFTFEYEGLHILNIPLDDKIPFCEYFIIPYDLWFFYVGLACLIMFLVADNKEFIQFALSLIIGMSIFLVVCFIYPNGITLRPEYVPDNFCGKLVTSLYAVDTSTNVFPSIHVYNSLAVNAAFFTCKALKNKNVLKIVSLILCISICLATMFLKQHSVVDVIGGVIMHIVLFFIIYGVEYIKTKKLNS